MQTKETTGVKSPTGGGQTTDRVTAEIVRTPDGELFTRYHARGRTYRSLDALQEAHQ